MELAVLVNSDQFRRYPFTNVIPYYKRIAKDNSWNLTIFTEENLEEFVSRVGEFDVIVISSRAIHNPVTYNFLKDHTQKIIGSVINGVGLVYLGQSRRNEYLILSDLGFDFISVSIDRFVVNSNHPLSQFTDDFVKSDDPVLGSFKLFDWAMSKTSNVDWLMGYMEKNELKYVLSFTTELGLGRIFINLSNPDIYGIGMHLMEQAIKYVYRESVTYEKDRVWGVNYKTFAKIYLGILEDDALVSVKEQVDRLLVKWNRPFYTLDLLIRQLKEYFNLTEDNLLLVQNSAHLTSEVVCALALAGDRSLILEKAFKDLETLSNKLWGDDELYLLRFGLTFFFLYVTSLILDSDRKDLTKSEEKAIKVIKLLIKNLNSNSRTIREIVEKNLSIVSEIINVIRNLYPDTYPKISVITNLLKDIKLGDNIYLDDKQVKNILLIKRKIPPRSLVYSILYILNNPRLDWKFVFSSLLGTQWPRIREFIIREYSGIEKLQIENKQLKDNIIRLSDELYALREKISKYERHRILINQKSIGENITILLKKIAEYWTYIVAIMGFLTLLYYLVIYGKVSLLPLP